MMHPPAPKETHAGSEIRQYRGHKIIDSPGHARGNLFSLSGSTLTIQMAPSKVSFHSVIGTITLRGNTLIESSFTLLLHKKHAKGVIKRIIAMILMKLASIHGNNIK